LLAIYRAKSEECEREYGVKDKRPLCSGIDGLTGGGIPNKATIPASNAYNVGANDFTLEAWVNLASSQPYAATAVASD
jgi:hypothetical protein